MQVGARALMLQAGLPAPFWHYAIEYFCLSYNLQSRGGVESPWQKRFGTAFTAPMLPFGSTVHYLPQPNSMVVRANMDVPTDVGILLGYVRKAGDDYGDVARVCPLSELHNLNMVTGKKPCNAAPKIEQTEQFFSNILGTLADDIKDNTPRFPTKDAYDKARGEVARVVIPGGPPPAFFMPPDVLPPLEHPDGADAGDVIGQADDGADVPDGPLEQCETPPWEGDDDLPEGDPDIPDDGPAGPRPASESEEAAFR